MLPVIALLLVSGIRQQSDRLPDTMPAKRLTDLIASFNTKDEAKIDAMVARDFAKGAFKTMSKEDWVAGILEASKNLAPIEFVTVLRTSESSIVVKLKGNTNQPLGIRVDLEAEQPFGILNAHVGSPDELVSTKPPRKFAGWTELYGLAEDVRSSYKLPGFCIAYQKLGEQPQVAVTGLRNADAPGASITLDDRMLVGSIGKAMTATLIAKLVDMKKLTWDTTLDRALPEIKKLDAYKGVTIEQLLNQQSGLPQDVQMSQADVDRIVGNLQTPTKIRKAYAADVLMRPPVEGGVPQKRQANSDYVLLGCIAERLINQPYEYLMDLYVFRPMKMTTALIAPVGSDDQFGSVNHVMGHLKGDFGYSAFEMPITKLDIIMAPAGGGVSCSIGDLLKFATFHLQGLATDAKILTPESYQKIHTASMTDAGEKYVGGWVIDAALEGEPCQWNNGTNGSYYAEMTIWPKSGLAIVAAMNAGSIRLPGPTMQAILAVRDKLESKN